MKSRRLRELTGLVLSFVMTCTLLPYTNVDKEQVVNAAPKTFGVADTWDILSEEGEEKGTKSNPFVILEIVPKRSYAEIGYTIAGCEPVDIKKLEAAVDKEDIKRLDDFGVATVTGPTIIRKFKEELGEVGAEWTLKNGDDDGYEAPGYYERVENGKGEFDREIQYLPPTEEGGELVPQYGFKSNHGGDYIWVTDLSVEPDIDPDYATDTIGHKVYTKRSGPYYEKISYTYKNENLFLTKVLGVTDEDKIKNYQIVVKTVIPSDLNGHEDYIDRADLIYINSTCHSTDVRNLWTTYKKFNWTDDGTNTFSDSNDLSWSVVQRIMKQITKGNGKHRTALLMDHQIFSKANTMFTSKTVNPKQIKYDGNRSSYGNDSYNASKTGYKANLYKLFLMTHFMDANVFSNLYLSDIDGEKPVAIAGVTAENYGASEPLIDSNGKFTKQENVNNNTYWNQYTFLMSKPNNSQGNAAFWGSDVMWENFRLNYEMNDTQNLNGKVFSVPGDKSLAFYLDQDTEVGITKFTKCLEDYATAKSSDKTVSLAIRYILDQTQGISDEINRDLDILELQPCSDFSLTEFRVRMWVPRSSGTIRVYHQTTNEFVGHIEDINSKYELIYMGMNTGKFEKDGSGKTVYNSNGPGHDSLDGKVYLHVGGRVNTENYSEIGTYPNLQYYDINTNEWKNETGLAQWKKNYDVRLPGNDITELKRDALINYLQAKYPVVVADSMYDDYDITSYTACKIDKFSNIYTVLKTARQSAPSNFLKESEVNKDIAHNLSTYVKEYRPILTILSAPPEYKGANDDGTVPDSSYINGSNPEYHYMKFKYRIDGSDTSKKYKVQLLVDKNSDGKFTESENLGTEIQDGGTSVYDITWDLGKDYIGAVSWKLVVVDEDDKTKRDEVIGVCARKNYGTKEMIEVLQVYDSTRDFWKLDDASGLFAQYTQQLNDFNIHVTRKTTSQLEGLYTVPYDATNSDTDQLKTYDMLIFGFADMYSNISNASGALDNVKDFIKAGKSVMFTHDVTSYNNAPGYANNQDNPNAFGYGFNVFMRTALCMDRFGCRIPRTTTNSSGNIINISDKCTDPSGNLYSENQGFTYYAIKRMAYSNGTRKRIFDGINYSESNATTNKATKINNGQLTRYPFYIPDGTIGTATTHGQYYQLDMNDPELVVWYALDGGPSNLYGISPKDASNNYYIYNCGNVTYTGVGHDNVGANSTPYEVKLFVNTMIAAYKNSVGVPTLEIVNADFQASGNNYYLYIDSDLQAKAVSGGAEEFSGGDNLQIKFKIRAHGLSNGDNMGVRISTEAVTGNAYDIKQLANNGTVVNPKLTINYGGTTDYHKVTNGVTYMIEYPKSDFSNKNVKTIKFDLKNDEGLDSTVYVNIMRRTLFKLN